ncbi:response regulator transcription factor [Halalkalibacter oceani]|uniref:response regulator transcription factor n=1 Tax=Halalkalibacter oceani TaxID=1653776 RepID=UPI0033919815
MKGAIMSFKKIYILTVDDEWEMRNLLRLHLTKQGFVMIEAQNGTEALKIVKKQPIDLIILDVMMPDMDGFELCTKIRESMTIPILMLTARTEIGDKVEGLNVGADDYLTKPFDPVELIARVNALLRRATMTDSKLDNELLSFTDLSVDPIGREVIVKGQPVEFTSKEFNLLLLLANNVERVFTRDHILVQIWGEDYFGDDRTVDTHIKNIRSKLRKAGLPYNLIHTVWGVGYKMKKQEE